MHYVFANVLGLQGVKEQDCKSGGCGAIWGDKKRTIARCRGPKQISKSKCEKTSHVRSTFWSWDVEKVYAVVARGAHIEVKSVKNWRSRSTFGSWDVENGHAVVGWRTFPRKHVQNTSGPEYFWQLRCQKNAQRCGAKHISKIKIVN